MLYEPEIPPNTGNVARTCAATGTPLHLIEPLGFSISSRQVRRAGLDYWNELDLSVHENWDTFLACAAAVDPEPRIAPLSTRGTRPYTSITEDMVAPGDAERVYLLFGPETRGLPQSLLDSRGKAVYRIPMSTGFRSLNLANTVALVLYELLARQGFPGLR